MFRFPFYGYPYSYPYYKYYNNIQTPHIQQKYIQPKEEIEEIKKQNSITNSFKISNTINSRFSLDSEEAIFELFGIKLYLDDLIILGLLFFLYQQNVNDEILYIILLLLLFS